MPSRLQVEGLVVDDDNSEKFARHGLKERQVLQVLESEHVIVPNRKRRRAPLLLIGRDNGGTCIAIPIEPTHDPIIWRPVIWRCKYHEEAKIG